MTLMLLRTNSVPIVIRCKNIVFFFFYTLRIVVSRVYVTTNRPNLYYYPSNVVFFNSFFVLKIICVISISHVLFQKITSETIKKSVHIELRI